MAPYLDGVAAVSEESEKMSVVSADSTVLATYPPSAGSSTKGSSCSMEAFVRAQNGDLTALGDDDDDLSLDGGGDTTGSNSPEHHHHHVSENDCMDEIEHIVKLLMT